MMIDIDFRQIEERILSQILYPEPEWIREERRGLDDQIMAEMLGLV